MDYEFDKLLGENIHRIRKKQNLTQEQLAAKLQIKGCDITRSALAKIEVGQRHIYSDEIKCLKEVLGVAYEDIFTEQKDMAH